MKLYIFPIYILLFAFTNIHSQSYRTEDSENGLIIYSEFNDEPYLLEGNNKNVINYFNAIEEDNPNLPTLPSKTIFIAIPPESKIKIQVLEEKTRLINNVLPQANPQIQLRKDSILNYINGTIDLSLSRTEYYPQEKFLIEGYIWIRSYYCAVVRINTHRYNWQNRQVIEITDAKIEITFYGEKPYSVNTSPSDDLEKSLEKVIINFPEAQRFRSNPPISALSDSTGNWIDYTKEYVKLQISNDGIYRIGYNDILSFGIPQSVNPKTFRIFSKGKELPLFVYGEDDSLFNEGDFVEFWGNRNYQSPEYRQNVPKGVDYLNYLDIYSDTSIVWLTWNGIPGLRTLIQNEYVNNLTDSVDIHKSILHLERDTRLEPYAWASPRSQLPFWQENKAWMWTTANSTGTRSIAFNAANFVLDSPVYTISRLMSSVADQIIINAHRFAAQLNSSAIHDTVTFDFESNANLISVFNSNDMSNGNNTYKIIGIPNDLSTFHRALLDWVDIEYYQYTYASNDSLIITIPDSVTQDLRVIKVSNFSSDSASTIIYKIISDTKRITSFKLNDNTLTFTDTAKGGDRYFVLNQNYVQQPNFLFKKNFLNLRNQNNQADYLIITHRSLENSVGDYKNFVESNYNLNVETIFVDDIYDEFGYGYLQPESLQEFLKYTFFYWLSPKPTYLVLIGDCTYDYKELWSTNKRRKILVPSFGLPVSDVWFTTWDTSNVNIQQMLVGRIPANNNEEVYRYLEKHQTYLQREYDEWNKNFLLFSGGFPDNPGEMEQIKQANIRVLTNVIQTSPVGGEAIHFYKTITPPTNLGPYTAEEIQNSLDYGGLFVSYVGHSGTRTWDNGISEPVDIKNFYADRLPLISDNGCSTGKFAEPDIDAFGELFISQDENGQAIGYFGNSSWGYTSTAFRMPEIFYNRIIIDSSLTIGQAHFLAKMDNFSQAGFGEVNRVYNYCNILLGDPVIKFAFPDRPNFVVNRNSIIFSDDFITDTKDTVDIKLVVANWGRVIEDSLEIDIKSIHSDSTIYHKHIVLLSPFYNDSLDLRIPVLGLAGEHTINVELDKNNILEEMSELDNIVQVSFIVYSTKIRPIEAEYFYNSARNSAAVLNPTIPIVGGLNEIEFALSQESGFTIQNLFSASLDSVETIFNFNNILPETRYYWRARLKNGEQEWSQTISFFNSNNFSWFINHSFNPEDLLLEKVKFDSSEQSWKIKQGVNQLKITSAGFSDGNYSSILYNLTEFLPNTLFRGFATALIDTLDLQPYNVEIFMTPVTPSQDSLINYLNYLDEGSVFAIAANDEVSVFFSGTSGDSLRTLLKGFGSEYVDSIGWRDSWVMIGIKGSPGLLITEIFSRRGNGPAIIDTAKIIQFTEGIVQFPPVTNVVKWLNVIKDDTLPSGASINYLPHAYKSDGSVDTLSQLNFTGNEASIEFIDAEIYRKISILAELNANSSFQSPELKSLAINFVPPPELAINYQVVSTSADTVLIGENVNLNFSVYNVGETTADSFKVMVDIINDDNTRQSIFEQTVDSLGAGERQYFEVIHNTSLGSGSKTFLINIDSDKEITELFEDNNFYTIPFFIKPDTTIPILNITFDGNDILDGDYISTEPEIKIELTDPSLLPINDPSSVMIFLNEVEIPSDSSILSYQFSETNPKVTVVLSPELSDGEYFMRVFGKDASGNLVDSAGVERYFLVSNEAKILYVYNYPNPFKDATSFTFKLTQIPDEIKIKIFTIAGRLVKEMKLSSSELNFDFNKIYWDGRDEDGDRLANGVYLYKIIMTAGDKTEAVTQKLAIVR